MQANTTTNNKVTKTAIRNLISDLGPDSGSIAITLHDLNIRGDRWERTRNPIAAYIRNELGLKKDVVVDNVNISVAGTSIPTPKKVSNFLTKFYFGDYSTVLRRR